jgi:hypothetical protein
MWKRLGAGLAVMLSSACAAKSAPAVVEPRLATFLPSEYAAYEGVGTSTITGQSFLKTRRGDVKFGAGDEIILNPVTTYSTEWWTKAIVGGKTLGPGDDRAKGHTRTAVADGEGRFRFDSLPAGRYYVLSSVVWEVPSVKHPGIIEQTGGLVGLEVTTRPGQTTQAILQLVRRYSPVVVPAAPDSSARKKREPAIPGYRSR